MNMHIAETRKKCFTFRGLMLLAGLAIFTWHSAAKTSTNGLTLLSPQGGVVYRVGDSMTVEWTIEPGISITGYVIEISPDNGLNWAYVKMVNGAMPEYFSHKIRCFVDSAGSNPQHPGMGRINLISDSANVKIYDYGAHGTYDVSAGSIRIIRADSRIIDNRKPGTMSTGGAGALRMMVLNRGTMAEKGFWLNGRFFSQRGPAGLICQATPESFFAAEVSAKPDR